MAVDAPQLAPIMLPGWQQRHVRRARLTAGSAACCVQADAADKGAKEGGSSSAGAGQGEGVTAALSDADYVNSLLGSLPGVDVNDPTLQVWEGTSLLSYMRVHGTAPSSRRGSRHPLCSICMCMALRYYCAEGLCSLPLTLLLYQWRH